MSVTELKGKMTPSLPGVWKRDAPPHSGILLPPPITTNPCPLLFLLCVPGLLTLSNMCFFECDSNCRSWWRHCDILVTSPSFWPITWHSHVAPGMAILSKACWESLCKAWWVVCFARHKADLSVMHASDESLILIGWEVGVCWREKDCVKGRHC